MATVSLPTPPELRSSSQASVRSTQHSRCPAEAGHANISRTRSVQFSNPSQPMSPSIFPRGATQQRNEQTESSADEITPIVGKERGPGRGKTYDATSLLNEEGTTSRQSNLASTRRRKPGTDTGNKTSLVEHESKAGWPTRLVEKYGSIELENKGSVARDHLALERTFLAWLRTSLAFASIGIAITQLFRLNTTIEEREGYAPSNPGNTYRLRQVGKPLGATFLGIAVIIILIGGRRYFESQYWIMRGKFPASRGSILLVTFIALSLIVTSLVVVCVVSPNVFEKR